MKHSNTIQQFFPALIGQIAAVKVDIEGNPPDWHRSLQRAIDSGSFLRFEFGFGAGGLVDSRIELVSQVGQATPISAASLPLGIRNTHV